MNLIPVLVAGTGHGLRVLVPALRATGFDVVGLVGANPVPVATFIDGAAAMEVIDAIRASAAAAGAVVEIGRQPAAMMGAGVKP